jgi:hypothetical protein
MTAELMTKAIRGAGWVHLGIIAANIPLPRRLRVREHLAGVPQFVRQIFYVHWVYIIIVLGMFAGLCFGFGCCGSCCKFSITSGGFEERTGCWTRCIWGRWLCSW